MTTDHFYLLFLFINLFILFILFICLFILCSVFLARLANFGHFRPHPSPSYKILKCCSVLAIRTLIFKDVICYTLRKTAINKIKCMKIHVKTFKMLINLVIYIGCPV